jgi:hypothetical protein
MQVVLRSGAAAFTWKTAYDERYHEVSPGMLLLQDCTAAFLSDPTLAFVDSCAHDDTGYMAAWTGRRQVADMWIDVRPGPSWRFAALAAVQRGYGTLRALAKRRYHALQRLRARQA